MTRREASVLIWSPGENQFVMLAVRQSSDGYQLIKTSEEGTEVLGSFARCEDAVTRWHELERNLARSSSLT
jgi:hypothetical protein